MTLSKLNQSQHNLQNKLTGYFCWNKCIKSVHHIMNNLCMQQKYNINNFMFVLFVEKCAVTVEFLATVATQITPHRSVHAEHGSARVHEKIFHCIAQNIQIRKIFLGFNYLCEVCCNCTQPIKHSKNDYYYILLHVEIVCYIIRAFNAFIPTKIFYSRHISARGVSIVVVRDISTNTLISSPPKWSND